MKNSNKEFFVTLEAIHQTNPIQPKNDDLIVIKSNYLEALRRVSLDYQFEEKSKVSVIKDKITSMKEQISNMKELAVDNFNNNTGKKLKGFPIVGFVVELLQREPQN